MMRTQVGVWIDKHEANVVFLSEGTEKARRIKSDAVCAGPSNNYYEEVFLAAHGADTVLIFGPGKAKGHLRGQFQRRHFEQRIVGFEGGRENDLRTGIGESAIVILRSACDYLQEWRGRKPDLGRSGRRHVRLSP